MSGPSDEEIVEAIREIVTETNFHSISVKQVRKALMERFNSELPEREEFIVDHLAQIYVDFESKASEKGKEGSGKQAKENKERKQKVVVKAKSSAKQSKKSAKKVKMPGEPQKPMTAYLFFQQDQRSRISSENPGASFGEITRLIAKEWKELPADEKKSYENKAEEDRQRYLKQKEEFLKSNLSIGLKSSSDDNISPSAIPKKTRKGDAQSNPRVKSRRVDNDESAGESEDDDITSTEKAKTLFDIALEKKKPKRKGSELDPQFVDQVCEDLLKRMDIAFQQDHELFKMGKPATKKLGLLEEVITEACNKHLQKHLLDSGLLSRLSDWLSPLSDGSLPNPSFRLRMYSLLDDLSIETDHLIECEDSQPDIGIGKVLMDLWRRENGKNQLILRGIIEKWARPLFGSVNDYKQLAVLDAEQRQHILKRSQKL